MDWRGDPGYLAAAGLAEGILSGLASPVVDVDVLLEARHLPLVLLHEVHALVHVLRKRHPRPPEAFEDHLVHEVSSDLLGEALGEAGLEALLSTDLAPQED